MAWVACSGSAVAQLPDHLQPRFTGEGVVRDGTVYFAKATGTLVGTREIEESRLATRAMRMLLQEMCPRERAAGGRLEAEISGLAMASSILRGRELEVVLRAPVQTPTCRDVRADVAAPGTSLSGNIPNPSWSTHPAKRDAGGLPLDPLRARERDITIRIFGSEY